LTNSHPGGGRPHGGAFRERLGVGLALAALLGALALFAFVLILSVELLHQDERPGGPSPLSPVQITGAEETVFSWRHDACEPRDIPDLPARAFRNARGDVQLIAPHYINRRFTGPDLRQLRHPCPPVMTSGYDPDPAAYNDREWIAAPFSPDGRTVYALVHNEYQGNQHPGRCSSGQYQRCWYNSITLAVSRDGGRTFTDAAPPPGHLVASSPYPYEPDSGPYGLFSPSNIVFNKGDDYYYALLRAEDYGAQQIGVCLIRTHTLSDPTSWRAWDGSAFRTSFVNPYAAGDISPRAHVCRPVAPNEIVNMNQSLTFNTYLDKWLLVGVSQDTVPGRGPVSGVFYSTSDDLIDWSRRRLIRETELGWTYKCGDPNPVSYPSVIDPDSPSRNFDTSGRSPYLYFTRFHYSNCTQNLNRDLVRVPIRFTK